MNDQRSKIISNDPVAHGVYRLRFRVHWSEFTQGQFVMLSIPGGETFLRKPFGIATLNQGVAEIFYKIVGKGTKALHNLPVGQELSVLGPTGNGFEYKDIRGTAVLIAGGYGISPLFGLGIRLLEDGRNVHLFYGAKSAKDLFLVEELNRLGVTVHLATEDGSAGVKGLVTELLSTDLRYITSPHIFSCGPEGLLQAVAIIAKENGFPAQLSLERYMACGIGVCLGCVCKDSKGNFVRTCREGPVFDIRDISLD